MVEQLQMLRDRLGWESDLEFYGRAMRNFQRIDSLFSPYSPADYADLLLALSNVDYKFLLDFEMGMEKQVRARLKNPASGSPEAEPGHPRHPLVVGSKAINK